MKTFKLTKPQEKAIYWAIQCHLADIDFIEEVDELYPKLKKQQIMLIRIIEKLELDNDENVQFLFQGLEESFSEISLKKSNKAKIKKI
tara:strand:+ start:489 stop:752 length:264 start_codon:yes stop_codon:yes gene_type:complete